MQTNAVATGKTILLRIELDEDTFGAYDAQALMSDKPIEDLIVQRLRDTQQYNSTSPLYLDDEHAAKVRRLLGGAVNSQQTLVNKIRALVAARFIGPSNGKLPEIAMSVAQIEQVASYAKSLGKSFDDTFVIVVGDAIKARLQA